VVFIQLIGQRDDGGGLIILLLIKYCISLGEKPHSLSTIMVCSPFLGAGPM